MHSHHRGFTGHHCHPGHFSSIFPGHFPPMFREHRFPGHHHHHRGWYGHGGCEGKFDTHQHPFSSFGQSMSMRRDWGRRRCSENEVPQTSEEEMLQTVREFFKEGRCRHGRRVRSDIIELSEDDEGKISKGTTTGSDEQRHRGKRHGRRGRFGCTGWTYGKCNAQQGRIDESGEVQYGWHYNPAACQYAKNQQEGRSDDEEPHVSKDVGKRRRRRGMSMSCRKLGNCRKFQCSGNEEVSCKTTEAMEIDERTIPTLQGQQENNTASEIELEDITDDLKKSNLD